MELARLCRYVHSVVDGTQWGHVECRQNVDGSDETAGCDLPVMPPATGQIRFPRITSGYNFLAMAHAKTTAAVL